MRAREGRELSDSERASLAKCLHFATSCGQASVADVCKEWGISKSHGYRILHRYRTEDNVVSRPRSRRPRALTEEDMRRHLRVYRRSATVTSRGNRSRRFSRREQVRAYRVQLCIILVKQTAGAKCASIMCLASTQKTWREDWSGQSSILITLGRGRKFAMSEGVEQKSRMDRH